MILIKFTVFFSLEFDSFYRFCCSVESVNFLKFKSNLCTVYNDISYSHIFYYYKSLSSNFKYLNIIIHYICLLLYTEVRNIIDTVEIQSAKKSPGFYYSLLSMPGYNLSHVDYSLHDDKKAR